MIGVCRKCGLAFETTTEDAYDPDYRCAECYRRERGLPPLPQRPDPSSPTPNTQPTAEAADSGGQP